MKTAANLDARPLGWQEWPTEAQIAEHEQGKGAWLARRPKIDADGRKGLTRLLLGLFDREGRFIYGGMGEDSYVRGVAQTRLDLFIEEWLFCPVDDWGRTVLLKSAAPSAAEEEPSEELVRAHYDR